MAAKKPPKGKFDAYVFMHLLETGRSLRDVVEAVGETVKERRNGFVGQFVGSFAAFGRFEVGSLRELQKLIAGPLWSAGVRSEWSTMVASSGIMSPKRGSLSHCALVRARTSANPFEVLGALDEHFKRQKRVDYGAAVVNGKFDLLIDLGANSFDRLKEILVEEVLGFPGISSTDTAFAYLPGNAIRA